MLSLFYFFLVHCFVLPTTDLRIQAVCTQNCCTSYDVYAVVLSLFPIILSLLVPIILKKEFYTYELCILRFMFIVAIDDKPRNRFYYKHVSVLYRRPSYFVSITMPTLLMSSTGLCPCVSLSVSRYCHNALDRSLHAGYAAAGSAVRQLDVRRSSVSLVPGCGGECILANNQKQ